MEAFNVWASAHLGVSTPAMMGVLVAILLAWFPGYNAHQRGHDHPHRVNAMTWPLAAGMVWCVVQGQEAFLPVLIGLWIAIIASSYGTRVTATVARPAPGFEVKMSLPSLRFAAVFDHASFGHELAMAEA